MKKQVGLIVFLGLLFLGIGCRQDKPNSDVANYYATVTKIAGSRNNPTSVPTATATATTTVTVTPHPTATATPQPSATPEVTQAIEVSPEEWEVYLQDVKRITPWQVIDFTDCAVYYFSQINFVGLGRQWQSAGLTWCDNNNEWFTIRLNGVDSIRVRQGTVVSLGSLGSPITVMDNEVKVYQYDRSIYCIGLTPDWTSGWRVSIYDCKTYPLNGKHIQQGYELLRNLETYYVE